MRTVDIFAAIVLIALSAIVAFVIIPAENTEGIWYGLSPYFYPMIMLCGVTIASVGLLIQAIARPHIYEDQPNPLTLEQFGFFLLISLIVLAGVLLVDYAGFKIGGPLIIAAAMLFMGERNPLIIIPVSIGTVAAVWAIVWWGLSTLLP
jgi:hypothetical protein